MELVFFAYTIFVMIVCAIAFTVSAVAHLVSGSRMFVFAALLFFCYFFDLTYIFQGEYLFKGSLVSIDMYYDIDQPLLKTVFALGVLESIWLIICSYLERKSPVLLAGPAVAFCLVSFLVVAVMPQGALKQWCFYSLREAFLLWCVAYAIFRYAKAQDALDKARLARQKPLVAATLVLIGCIVAENTTLILLWTPSSSSDNVAWLLFFSTRNISENVLILVYAFVAIKASVGLFRARRNEDPRLSPDDRYQNDLLLPRFCAAYKLTPRERDVLSLMLQGKDYRSIASELQLAMGTVKSHTHNILKKTDSSSRQELMRKFWQS